MPAARKALIIGAGIAGPALAMALQKAGIDSAVFEAHPSDSSGVGAFLTVASNGVDALGVLDSPEVLDRAFTTPFIVLRSSTGKYLGRLAPASSFPVGRRVRPSLARTCTRACTTRRPSEGSRSTTAAAWSASTRALRGCGPASPTPRRKRAIW